MPTEPLKNSQSHVIIRLAYATKPYEVEVYATATLTGTKSTTEYSGKTVQSVLRKIAADLQDDAHDTAHQASALKTALEACKPLPKEAAHAS